MPRTMTLPQHLKEIDNWCDEIVADREGAYAVTKDEIYSDTVQAYISAEVGERSKMARDIRQATGL